MREFLALLLWAVIGLLLLSCLVELSNWFVLRRLEEFTALPRAPRVSILVPARNEARSIERCVASLLAQDYPDFDVLVLDDESTDGTGEILHRLAAGDRRLRLLGGQPLPAGWIGKNWACHQLLEKEDGEYILYVDADTWHHPAVVRNGISAMLAGKLDLLSAIPQEVTGSFGELLAVPIVVWGSFAVLPLWLAFHTKTPLLASAIGQHMMFRASSLRQIGGFQRIRSKINDDVSLAHLVKGSGMRWRIVDGTGRVYCRMYHGFRETVEGFSKNLYAVFNHNPLLLTFVCLLTLMVYTAPITVLLAAALGYPISYMSVGTCVGAIGLSVLEWSIIVLRFHFPWVLCMTWILGQPVFVFITLRSMWQSLSHRASWKGRIVDG
jgi:chlorobactene glucosyltransferase